MRKNWKKLVSLVLTAACTMVVTVAPVFADAASTPAYSPVEASTVDSLLSSSVQWVGQSLMTYSDDDLANMEASDQQFYARAAEAWEEAKADLGEVKSLEDGTLEVDGDFVTCTIPGEFEKNPGIVRVFWNISTGTPVPTDLTITVEESKGVLIGQAGMNTIIGIGTVFVMLIFLIFVISSFDYILGDKKKKKHRQHLYRKHQRLSQHRLLKRQHRKQTIWSCRLLLQLQSPCMKKIWLLHPEMLMLHVRSAEKAKELKEEIFNEKLHHYRKRKCI